MERKGNIKIRVIISVFAIALVNGLQHTLSPVLSGVREHYSDVDVSLVQMLVTVPMFIAIIFALLTGWLALYISKKKIFLFAALVSAVTGFMPMIGEGMSDRILVMKNGKITGEVSRSDGLSEEAIVRVMI